MKELFLFLVIEAGLFVAFMVEEVIMNELKGVTLWDIIVKFITKTK